MDPHKLIEEPLWQAYATAVIAAASWAGRRAVAKYARSAAKGPLRVLVPATVATAAVVVWWKLDWPNLPLFVIFSLAVVLAFAAAELAAFWRAGLEGADPAIRKGLNYKKALSLCHNELCLLGIGAAKLTAQPNFRAALKRCAEIEGGNIRFLLTRPENAFLQEAARQAGERVDEYQQRVEDSLRTLARIHLDEGVKMEVRFYTDPAFIPLFRLMFIDDRLCLVSYNAFGHGDGSGLPQIRVSRRTDAQKHVSFYYPYRLYFETLWKRAEPWEPSKILKR